MQQSAVQEHAREQGDPRHVEWRRRPHEHPAGELHGHNARGEEQLIERIGVADAELENEDQDVHHQDGEHDPRKTAARARVVLDRDHRSCDSCGTGRVVPGVVRIMPRPLRILDPLGCRPRQESHRT